MSNIEIVVNENLSVVAADLIDNDDDGSLPYGHAEGEVKGPDPAQHPNGD